MLATFDINGDLLLRESAAGQITRVKKTDPRYLGQATAVARYAKDHLTDLMEEGTGEALKSGIFRDKRGHRYRLERGIRVPIGDPEEAKNQPLKKFLAMLGDEPVEVVRIDPKNGLAKAKLADGTEKVVEKDKLKIGPPASSDKPTIQGGDEPEKPARVLFEVAPDPNAKDLVEPWKALSDQERLDISRRVASKIMPQVFKLAGVEAELTEQFGGYQKDTNPSFAAVVPNEYSAKKLLEVAKLGGFALSQDSVMVVSGTPFDGAEKVGFITVELPKESDIHAVHAVYQKIREATGEDVQGHSTVHGEMAIVVDVDKTEELAHKINRVLGGQHEVSHEEGYRAFPHKEDYDYASQKGSSELAEKLARGRHLRSAATNAIRKELGLPEVPDDGKNGGDPGDGGSTGGADAVPNSPDRPGPDTGSSTGKADLNAPITKEDTTAPPPSKDDATLYEPDPNADSTGNGITDAARVGVPGNAVPPPPAIGRLPRLTRNERLVESRFADAYQQDPQAMVDTYNEGRNRIVGKDKNGNPKYAIGDAPNIFATDDAKLLSDVYNPPPDAGVSPEDVMAMRSRYNTVLHNTANAIAKKSFLSYLDKLKELPDGHEQKSVLVTSGGVASGKGYALGKVAAVNNVAQHAGAVWDAAGEANGTENDWILSECKARGIKPTFAFVHANPHETWENPQRGVVERAGKTGRMVDARLFADSYTIGAKNFAAFHKNNAASGEATFFILDNTGKEPKELTEVPKEALELDGDELYRRSVGYVQNSGTVAPAVKRGATNGLRIWPEKAGGDVHESKDAEGHEHKGKGEGGGQFTGSGGGSSGKPAHGSRAAALHAQHQKLKQDRIDTFNAVKADAEAALDQSHLHFGEIEGPAADLAWDTDNEDEAAFNDLESAVSVYNPSDTIPERFSALKDIEQFARAALTAKQTETATPDAHREFAELSSRIKATYANSEKLMAEFKAAKAAGDTKAMAANTDQWNTMTADREQMAERQKALQIDDGMLPEVITQNKQHLRTIITNARAARQQIKTYVQHRQEMKAIKTGSPIDVQESMLMPDGDGIDLLEVKDAASGGNFADTLESGFTGVITDTLKRQMHFVDGKHVKGPDDPVGAEKAASPTLGGTPLKILSHDTATGQVRVKLENNGVVVAKLSDIDMGGYRVANASDSPISTPAQRSQLKQELGEKYWGNKNAQPYYRPGPNPTVDNVLTRDGAQGREVLLIQRKKGTVEGEKWALPGGFHDTSAKKGEPWKEGHETAAEAALRELAEETGLDASSLKAHMRFTGTYEGSGRDPRDNAEAWSRSSAFHLHLTPELARKAVAGQDDAQDAKWIPLRKAAKLPMAFDHAKILKDAQKATAFVRGKGVVVTMPDGTSSSYPAEMFGRLRKELEAKYGPIEMLKEKPVEQVKTLWPRDQFHSSELGPDDLDRPPGPVKGVFVLSKPDGGWTSFVKKGEYVAITSKRPSIGRGGKYNTRRIPLQAAREEYRRLMQNGYQAAATKQGEVRESAEPSWLQDTLEAEAPIPPKAPKPPKGTPPTAKSKGGAGFTGTDSHGHKWVAGEQVAIGKETTARLGGQPVTVLSRDADRVKVELPSGETVVVGANELDFGEEKTPAPPAKLFPPKSLSRQRIRDALVHLPNLPSRSHLEFEANRREIFAALGIPGRRMSELDDVSTEKMLEVINRFTAPAERPVTDDKVTPQADETSDIGRYLGEDDEGHAVVLEQGQWHPAPDAAPFTVFRWNDVDAEDRTVSNVHGDRLVPHVGDWTRDRNEAETEGRQRAEEEDQWDGEIDSSEVDTDSSEYNSEETWSDNWEWDYDSESFHSDSHVIEIETAQYTPPGRTEPIDVYCWRSTDSEAGDTDEQGNWTTDESEAARDGRRYAERHEQSEPDPPEDEDREQDGDEFDDLSDSDVREMFGAAELGLTIRRSGNDVTATHPKFDSCNRTLGIDRNGEKFIHNDLFIIKEEYRGDGFGTEVFNAEAEGAAANGFDYIVTHAARGYGARGMNGYYTWLTLGYDMDLEPGSSFTREVQRLVPGAKTYQDLMHAKTLTLDDAKKTHVRRELQTLADNRDARVAELKQEKDNLSGSTAFGEDYKAAKIKIIDMRMTVNENIGKSIKRRLAKTEFNGNDYWLALGFGLEHAKFDLTAGSESRKILAEVMVKSRAKKGKKI